MGDARDKVNILLEQLRDIAEKALDSSSIVTFKLFSQASDAVWSAGPAAPKQSSFDILLDLQAGADVEDAWSLTQNAECENHAAGSDEDGPEHAPKDNIVRIGQALLQRMASEVQGQLEAVSGPGKCLLCPCCTFKRIDRLQASIKRYHTKERRYICSGAKQTKVACALFDIDQITGICGHDYIQRSADVLKKSLRLPLRVCVNQIDRYIRLVLTEDGPTYVIVTALHTEIFVRRAHYTQGMADIVYQEMLMCNAKFKAVSRLCLWRVALASRNVR